MGKQYLTFTLADTIYAVNVFQVREVLSYVPPQTLPNPDPVIEGLIRSRDQSISVINLRRRFGLEDREPDKATRIIVLEICDDESGEENVFGAVADGVNEVLDLDKIGCELTPELGNSPAAAFIKGIGRQDEKFIIILDVDKIFSFSEMAVIEKLASENSENDVPRVEESVEQPSVPGDVSSGNISGGGTENPAENANAGAGAGAETAAADSPESGGDGDEEYADADIEDFEEL